MDKVNQRSSPCIEFALIDAGDPTQVARFMFWLDRGKWPEEGKENILRALTEAKDITMDEYIEISWMFDAPRHRILKLLWQLLQDNHSEEFFWNKFTIGLDEFAGDAASCSKVLPIIQQRLRWVLEGVEEVSRQEPLVGQGNWGEEWFMSPDRAALVRKQLSKVHVGILEKASDYEEMLQTGMNLLMKIQAQVVDIPIDDPERNYIGDVLKSGDELSMRVWVEGGAKRQGLVNVNNPWLGVPGRGFGWGYFGGGPRALASSILADVMGGDIAIADQYWQAFRNDVISRLPAWGPFSLSRVEVLEWLSKQGLGDGELVKWREEFQRRVDAYGPELARLRTKLDNIASMGGLRAQRFDFVPDDFESALYVDLMQMLQRGGRILRCARCSLPISYDGSSRSNRQRARWESGRPIYHDQCGRETVIERKRAYWHKRASDAEFKEQRRYSAKSQRRTNTVRRLVGEGEGQRIEFKQSFSEQNEAIISLCAFTHAGGGTVVFGVTNDGAIAGVSLGKNTMENFANELRQHTQPPLIVSVEQIMLDGKVVVTANVGRARLGQLFHAFNTPYIRVGKTNQVIPSEEQRVRLMAGQSALNTT